MSDKTPPAAQDLSELEKPILELEAQIRALELDPSKAKEQEKLERRLQKLKSEVFANITDWQRAQLARDVTQAARRALKLSDEYTF